MLMAPFLADKKRAFRFRVVVNIHGRHPRGLEAHRPAPVREIYLMGNKEILAEKTINERSSMFF
jgi:hypothetical protein